MYHKLIEAIEKAQVHKIKLKLMDKMGGCFYGYVIDSWLRIGSGGHLRGKFMFNSDEKGEFELDINDVLDIENTNE